MAVEIGVASDHIDLLDKLISFLSTNSELVASGQNWEILRNAEFPHEFPFPGRIGFATNNGSYPTSAPLPWPTSVPSTNVKIKLEGKITVPTTGMYRFYLSGDDQTRLYIDDDLVMENQSANQSTGWTRFAEKELTAGEHDIVVYLIQIGGNASVSLAWRKPGDDVQTLIPAEAFSEMSAHYGYARYANPSSSDIDEQLRSREVILRGPGSSGADEVYVGLDAYGTIIADLFNWDLRIFTGYDPTRYWYQQPNVSAVKYHRLWNQSIPYWFIANGRRFMVISKVSTNYSNLYAGFYLPYGIPGEIPYPIALGADSVDNTRWSAQSENNGSFWNPSVYNNYSQGTLTIRRTDGDYEHYANFSWSSSPPGRTYPYAGVNNFRPSPSGDYALQPVTLVNSQGGGNVWGELDGVYHVSGFNNASENIHVIDGKSYLVVQASHRTTIGQYAALLLE